jgi:hypothetical protein
LINKNTVKEESKLFKNQYKKYIIGIILKSKRRFWEERSELFYFEEY